MENTVTRTMTNTITVFEVTLKNGGTNKLTFSSPKTKSYNTAKAAYVAALESTGLYTAIREVSSNDVGTTYAMSFETFLANAKPIEKQKKIDSK